MKNSRKALDDDFQVRRYETELTWGDSKRFIKTRRTEEEQYIISSTRLRDKDYLRGLRYSKLSSGVLANEAFHLFNFGTVNSSPTVIVSKSFPALSPISLDQAMLEFGGKVSHLFYEHINELTFCNKVKFAKHFDMNNPYIAFTANAHYSRSWLAPFLFNNSSILRSSSKNQAFSLKALFEVHKEIERLLSHREFDNYVKSLYNHAGLEMFLNKNQATNVGFDWVLTKYSLLEKRNFIKEFFSTDPDQVGLAEYIWTNVYGTQLISSLRAIPTNIPNTDQVFGIGKNTINQLVERVFTILSTLETTEFTSPAVKNYKGRLLSRTQLYQWIEDATLQKEFFNLYLLCSRGYIPENAYDPTPLLRERTKKVQVYSFLAGIVLSDYIILILLRAILSAVVSSFPFAQIFHGGPVCNLTGNKFGRKSGIYGPTGVAFWEMFGGKPYSSTFYRDARSSMCSFSIMEIYQKKWIPNPENLIQPPRKLINKSRYDFRQSMSLYGDSTLEQETLHLLDRIGDDRPRGTINARQLLAAYGNGALKKSLRIKNNDLKTLKDSEHYSEIQRTSPLVNLGSTKPVFEPLIIHNPPILDLFYEVTVFTKGAIPLLKGGGPEQKLKQDSRVHYGRSDIVYGCKLLAQLQSFVASEFVKLGMNETKFALDYPEVTEHITFTCANTQWGGKFPPHVSHRDGWGIDWGMRGRPDSKLLWHHSVHWPKDATKVKKSTTNEKVMLSELLLGKDSISKLAATYKSIFKAVQKKPNLRGLREEDKNLVLVKHERLKRLVKAVLRRIEESLAKKELLSLKRSSGDGFNSRDIPVEALIAQSSTPATENIEDDQTVSRYLIFREPLKRALAEDFHTIRKTLRDYRNTSIDDDNKTVLQENDFETLENKYLGFPVFADIDSHCAHHLTHLAVILSMPHRIIWGAPIYHFRAARAIHDVLLSDDPGFFREEGQGDPGEDNSPIRMTIPEFIYMPHNHHHHWHITYWKPSALRSYKRKQNRFVSNDISSESDYLTACLRFWRWLGIRLDNFQTYLAEYKMQLQHSTTKEAKSLGQEISLIQSRIDDVYNSQNAVYEQGAAEARREKLFSYLYELAKQNQQNHPAEMLAKGQWPKKDSLLNKVIEFTEVIETELNTVTEFLNEDGTLKESIYEDILSDDFLTAFEEGSVSKLSELSSEGDSPEDNEDQENFEDQETDNDEAVEEDPLPINSIIDEE